MIKTLALVAIAVLALSGTAQAKEFWELNETECKAAGGFYGEVGSGHVSGITFPNCYKPEEGQRFNPGLPTQNAPTVGPGGTTVVAPVSTGSKYYGGPS